jgi:hypothetical protein
VTAYQFSSNIATFQVASSTDISPLVEKVLATNLLPCNTQSVAYSPYGIQGIWDLELTRPATRSVVTSSK